MTGDCCVSKFFQCSVNGKYLMRFQSENAVFQLLRRSVDEKQLTRLQSKNAVCKFLWQNVPYEALDSWKHGQCHHSETCLMSSMSVCTIRYIPKRTKRVDDGQPAKQKSRGLSDCYGTTLNVSIPERKQCWFIDRPRSREWRQSSDLNMNCTFSSYARGLADRAVFTWASKSNWFCNTTLHDWLQISRHFFIQSEVNPLLWNVTC